MAVVDARSDWPMSAATLLRSRKVHRCLHRLRCVLAEFIEVRAGFIEVPADITKVRDRYAVGRVPLSGICWDFSDVQSHCCDVRPLRARSVVRERHRLALRDCNSPPHNVTSRLLVATRPHAAVNLLNCAPRLDSAPRALALAADLVLHSARRRPGRRERRLRAAPMILDRPRPEST